MSETSDPSVQNAVTSGAATPPEIVPTEPEGAIARFADGIIAFVAKHWLALFNTVWGIYVLAPFAAATFMHWGWTAPASVIYRIYSFLCHQLPDHSYFLFGPSFFPSREQLIAAGMPDTANILVERAFIGNPEIGWKVALCERDIAIYGAVFLTGLLFALLRDRVNIRISWKGLALFAVPIAIDGFTQMLGWRESNWWLRTVTGALFGVGAVLWAYPFVNDAMADLLREETERKARYLIAESAEVAEKRREKAE